MEEIDRKMEKICEMCGKNDNFMIESNWKNVKEYFKLDKFYTKKLRIFIGKTQKNCEYLSKNTKNIYKRLTL